MSRYLETLIAQARGAEPEIQPRMRSRFEPDMASVAQISEEPLLDHPHLTTEPAVADLNERVRTSDTDSGVVVQPQERLMTEIRRETVHHTHHESDRFERVVHHEAGLAAAGPSAPAPEKVVAIEHMPVMSPQPDLIEPARMPQPSAILSVADPVPRLTLPEPSASQRRESERRESEEVMAQPLRMVAGPPAPEPIQSRRDLVAFDATPKAPEITISIGVLDIRLTQETAPDRRHQAAAPERRESPMPLADYLARRSGGAS